MIYDIWCTIYIYIYIWYDISYIYDIWWYILIYHDISGNFVIKNKKHHFIAKARNYGIFVVKIYDYALLDSFWGSAGFIDSPTSYATLRRNLRSLFFKRGSTSAARNSAFNILYPFGIHFLNRLDMGIQQATSKIYPIYKKLSKSQLRHPFLGYFSLFHFWAREPNLHSK